MYLPPRDIVFYDVAAHSTQLSGQRLKVLESLVLGKQHLVVASIEALLCIQTPPSVFKEGLINIEVGQVIAMEELARKLTEMGYERVPNVEGPGQFSVRGGILDVYPMTQDDPAGWSFGDEVTPYATLIFYHSALRISLPAYPYLLPGNWFYPEIP